MFWRLDLVAWTNMIATHMVFAPEGLQDSARRFNAGNIQCNGFDLQVHKIGPVRFDYPLYSSMSCRSTSLRKIDQAFPLK